MNFLVHFIFYRYTGQEFSSTKKQDNKIFKKCKNEISRLPPDVEMEADLISDRIFKDYDLKPIAVVIGFKMNDKYFPLFVKRWIKTIISIAKNLAIDYPQFPLSTEDLKRHIQTWINYILIHPKIPDHFGTKWDRNESKGRETHSSLLDLNKFHDQISDQNPWMEVSTQLSSFLDSSFVKILLNMP